jgi:hypothetical protein
MELDIFFIDELKQVSQNDDLTYLHNNQNLIMIIIILFFFVIIIMNYPIKMKMDIIFFC